MISIIALLASMTIPQFLGNAGRLALKDAAGRLSDIMWFCHSTAAFEGRTFRLNLAPDGRRFQITFEPDPLERKGEFRAYRESGLSVYNLPDNVLVRSFRLVGAGSAGGEARTQEEAGGEGSGESVIEFRKDGTADAANLVLEDREGQACEIRVSGLTSQVRIMEWTEQGENDRFAETPEGSEEGLAEGV